MPIFSKPNAIVYLRRSGLIIAGKKLTPARYSFLPEHIENLDITDTSGFTRALREFFSAHSMNGKHVLMVLDDSVVFMRSGKSDSDTASEGASVKPMDSFIEQMPLNPGQRACISVKSDIDSSLYGTNAELYMTVADALDQAGVAKVLAITPAAAYPSESGKQQLAAAVQQYITDTAVRSSANFQNATVM